MTDDERAAAAYERGLQRGQNDERENYYNESPLSGEWAGESIVELLGDLFPDDGSDDPSYGEISDLCAEYERGYRDAFTDRVFCDECGDLCDPTYAVSDDVLAFCGTDCYEKVTV